MKQIVILLAGLLFTINTYAQQAEAQLLFEEAETLFNRFMTLDCESNPQDCQATLMLCAEKLDGAEKIVGEKPKIIYLSALVQKGVFDLFDYSHLYDKEYGEQLFDLVNSLRETSKRYMELKQNDEVDDRYREMKKIIDELQKYPKDRTAWLEAKEKKEADERVAAEWDKVQEERLDAYYREIAPKIDAWEYKNYIKIGGNYKGLVQQFPSEYKYLKGGKYSSSGSNYLYDKRKVSKVPYPYINSVNLKDGLIEGYEIYRFLYLDNKVLAERDNIYNSIFAYFGIKDRELLLRKGKYSYDYYVIDSPYSDYHIWIQKTDNFRIIKKSKTLKKYSLGEVE